MSPPRRSAWVRLLGARRMGIARRLCALGFAVSALGMLVHLGGALLIDIDSTPPRPQPVLFDVLAASLVAACVGAVVCLVGACALMPRRRRGDRKLILRAWAGAIGPLYLVIVYAVSFALRLPGGVWP